MDRYFSGITALRYLRTPPQVLALYPPLAEPYQDSNHMKLASSPLIEDILHTPLDCTVFHANKRRSSKYYRYHLSNTDLPFGIAALRTSNVGRLFNGNAALDACL